MLLFPNAKINLGLHITGKRADGYHELATVFYPVLLKDMLEIIQSDKAVTNSAPPSNSTIIFTTTGLTIPGEPDKNLCVKAYHLLKKDYPELPAIKMHLHKIIPMGGGLGGGSSNAAAVLSLLNDLCQLNCSDEVLENFAAQLGSDCAFFIKGGMQLCTGRGEILTSMSLSLAGYWIVLINNGTHVSTKTAFSKVQPLANRPNLPELLSFPISEWKHHVVNDFEASVFAAVPELAVIKDALYDKGAVYASMSGSGATMYGIFKERPTTISWDFEPVFEYWIAL
jgi:4-diphosphocytidyl-2-C-methyl-D-erythritol kinase